MRNLKRVLFTSAMVLALAFGSVCAEAQSIKDLKSKQSDVKAEMSSINAALQKAKDEKNALLQEIIEMDIVVQTLSDELDFITQELDSTKEILAKAELELDEARAMCEQQRAALIKRLRAIDENGTVSYIEMFLSSKSLSDFLDRMEDVKSIAEYDKKLISQLVETENVITEKVVDIGIRKAEIEVLYYQQEVKIKASEEQIAQKNKRVESLLNDQATSEKFLAELESTSKSIEKLIKQAEAKEAAAQISKILAGNGKFGWPVQGYVGISSYFERRTNPVTGKAENHSGIDIPAPAGTNILAGEAGTVIFAGWKGGYGYCVIVDHGGGLSTLYAHASRIVTSVGSTVTRGQVIAKVGTTGQSTGNHLHFEVRKNGAAVNPISFVK